MLMVESHSTAASNFYSSIRRLSYSSSLIQRNKYRRCATRVKIANGIRATAKPQAGSDSGPVKKNAKVQKCHPFEDIAESDSLENGEATLSPAETAKTIVEVNNKASLMFSGMVNEEIRENFFWPDLPYFTDERGNIYFQVKNDQDILDTETSEALMVQVLIGIDTAKLIGEMEALGHSSIEFGTNELDAEESDFDDDEDEEDDDGDENEDEDDDEDEWVSILEEDDEDEESDGSLGDWAKLETMRSSHPMHFAKKLADVVSDDPVDCMEQSFAGLAIHGLIRTAFVEEHSIIQKHIASSIAEDESLEGSAQVNGHTHEKELAEDKTGGAEELEKDGTPGKKFAFYKVEMIDIQLLSANGHKNNVEIDDFHMAQPDPIAHSAAKIISRLKAGGERTMQALISLCWRCKGIQVEECALIGIDSLGFDLKVCSETQIQTLRFAFKKRASSEYSAERQLNDLLFPKAQKYQQQKRSSPD